MIRPLLLSLTLLAAAACTDDAPANQDMGNNTNNTADTGNNLADMELDQPQDMPPEDMAPQDMPLEDMPLEDMTPEDMPPEDMTPEDMPPEDMPPEDMPIGDSLCSNAMDVTAGGVWANQTTVGAGENYEARVNQTGCPNGRFSGEDRAYVVQPTVETTYTVLVEPQATFDPMIYVRTDCDAEACVTGTVLNGTGVQESVTFTAMPNQRTHIIVDGELGSAGSYTLTVTVN